MPIYEYIANDADSHCPHCRNGFEVLARIEDPPPTGCPQCGAPVQRRPSAPRLARHGAAVDDRRAAALGFTQYRRAGKGVYEKAYGEGPAQIADDGGSIDLG